MDIYEQEQADTRREESRRLRELEDRYLPKKTKGDSQSLLNGSSVPIGAGGHSN